MRASTASAFFFRDGRVALAFPYDRGAVTALKVGIPARERGYSRATRVWTVSAPWAERAVALLRFHFSDVDVIRQGRGGEQPAPLRAADPSFAELHLLPSAPPELVEAAYRMLARLNHPDVGGDAERMTALNLAYDELRRKGAA
jgi:hypothetical protein